jgi:hypothetical protein
MPGAVSVQAPAIPWDHETVWPGKPDPPTAAGTTTNRDTVVSDTSFGNVTQALGAADVGAGGVRQLMSAANRWCVRTTTLALADQRVFTRRFLTWTPYLDPATAPLDGGDEGSRIGWLRFHVLAELDVDAGATVDALGVSIIADDGLIGDPFAAWLSSLAGGIGIYKRAGLGSWRYASYSAAPALLEAIDLPSDPGWHTADFVFRQAARDDAATPWLTFSWDGVDVYTERAFGHALLPAPGTLRPGAHGWAIMVGNYLTSGELSFVMECRQGGRLPNGVPVLR